MRNPSRPRTARVVLESRFSFCQFLRGLLTDGQPELRNDYMLQFL